MAIAGVLYVWSLAEFSSAIASDRKSGIHRFLGRSVVSTSIRLSAAGESSASHSPPSEAKAFCGAK